jgi:hypothetical protein
MTLFLLSPVFRLALFVVLFTAALVWMPSGL